jgi:hypothetical protein
VRLEDRVVSIIDLKKALTGEIDLELEQVAGLISGVPGLSDRPARAV